MNAIRLVDRSWNTHEKSLTLVKPSYGFIDTSKIVERFERQGWNLHTAKQANVKTNERMGYQKHLLSFRNDNFKHIDGLSSGNASIPELVVENSHDGSSALRLFFGVFRIACLNGIIAGQSLTHFRVIHSGNAIKNIDTAIDGMTENVPKLIERVSRLNTVQLTADQAQDMALKASQIRLQYIKNVQDVNLAALLTPKRYADQATDAFSIFNVIQEKVLRGGIKYQQLNLETGFTDRKTTRAISSVSQSVKLNRELWDIAETVIEGV